MRRKHGPAARVLKKLSWAGLALLATGCGDGDAATVRCGPGTSLRGALCVLDDGGNGDGGGLGCGPGTVETDGLCLPDPDADAGLACGDGTLEVAGRCIPDPDTTPVCGAGTVLQGNTCVPVKASPSIQGLKVSHLAFRAKGTVLDGTTGHDTLTQYYPVEVSLGLTYRGDAAKIPVQVNLTAPDASAPTPGCSLGGVLLDHPGGLEATEALASIEVQVPRGCLDAAESSRVVTPIVLIDPDRTLNADDQDAVSRAIAFHASNTSDADLAACHRALDGAVTGNCALELKVVQSPGVDFELASLQAESSVMVLDRCGEVAPRLLDQAGWAALLGPGAPALDVERPVSYRCNSAIVPEFAVKTMRGLDGNYTPVLDEYGKPQLLLDAAGNPSLAQVQVNGIDYPSYLYGEADLALNVTVIAHGEPSSDQTEFEAARLKLGNLPNPVAHDALPDIRELKVSYKIRPSSSTNDADFRLLYLHKKNDQAKATPPGGAPMDVAPSTADVIRGDGHQEPELVPETPSYFSHGLYLENDCGEKNRGFCNAALNPRDDVIYGAWKDETNFTLRACVIPVNSTGPGGEGEELADLDRNPSNNCKDLQVRIVRSASSGRTKAAASYDFNKDWSNLQGNAKPLALITNIFTHNHVDTVGATTDNQAAVNVSSALVGSIDMLRGWGKAAGYVSVVGSYYDYGISVFGKKFWGESKEVSEYHWERNFSMSKEQRWDFRLWAGIVPVGISLRLYGEVGLALGLDVVAVADGSDDGEEADADGLPSASTGNTDQAVLLRFPGSTRIGLATVTAKPYGLMKATASAAVDLLVVRAGVAGELTLLNLQTPLRGYLAWGATSLTPAALRAGVWADIVLNLSVMQGRVYVYLEHWGIWGCGRWCLTSGYRTFWDYTLASWSGWSWNQTLWSTPFYNYDVKL